MRNNSIFHRPMRLLAASSLLFAALLAAQPAVAQLIAGSKHDLSTGGGGTIKQTTGTTEICVFCHTPHGATTVAPTGLLWNRTAGATAGYTVYQSASLNSVALQPMGSSTMCFSCHDGVISIDNVVNRPGSGGYTATPSVWAAPYVWANGGALAGVAALGLDISNDHPIGVAYCGGFNATSNLCNDPDFKQTVATQQLNRRNAAGTIVSGAAAGVTSTALLTDTYWIDTVGAGTTATANIRDKSDMILYARAFTTPSGNNPSVECASCHEPHAGVATTPGDGLTSFLRMPNATSRLCLSCHTK